MRRSLAVALLVAFAPLAARPLCAQAAGDFTIRNFRFASCEVLSELRLHYMTMGRPRRDAAGVVRNAVILPASFTTNTMFPMTTGELLIRTFLPADARAARAPVALSSQCTYPW